MSDNDALKNKRSNSASIYSNRNSSSLYQSQSSLASASAYSSKSTLATNNAQKTVTTSSKPSSTNRIAINEKQSTQTVPIKDSRTFGSLESNMHALGLSSIASSLSPTLNAQVALVSPATAFKLCKKIAQLTKVIYYLNTKTEDHDTAMTSLAAMYEQEIGAIIKDANDRLAEKTKATEMYEQELKLFSGELEDMKQQLQIQLNANNDLSTQIQKSKDEAVLAAAHKEALATKLRLQAKEFSELADANTEKYQQETAKLEEQLRDAVTAGQQTADELRNLNQTAEVKYSEKINELEMKMCTLNVQNMQQISAHENNLTALKQEAAEKYNSQLTKAQSMLTQVKLDLSKAVSDNNALKNTLESKTMFLNTIETKMHDLTCANLQLEARNKQLLQDQENLTQQHAILKAELGRLNSETLNLKTENESIGIEFQDAKRDMSKLEAFANEKVKEIAEASQNIEVLQDENKSLRLLVEKLQSSNVSLERKQEAASKAESQLQKELDNLKKKHATELRSSLDRLEEDLSREHLEEIQTAKRQLEQSVENLENELESVRSQSKQSLEQTKVDFERDLCKLQEEHKVLQLQHKNELDLLLSSKTHMQEQSNQLQQKVLQFSSTIESLESSSERLKAEIARLKKENAERVALSSKNQAVVQRQWEEKLLAAQRQWDLTWETKTECAVKNALDSQEQSLRKEFSEHLYKITEKHNSALKTLKLTHHEEAAKEQKLREETHDLLLRAQNNFAELQTKYKEQQEKYSHDMRTLQETSTAKFNTAQEELRTALEAQHEEHLRLLEAKYESIVHDAKASQSKAVDDAKRAHLMSLLTVKKDAEAQKNNEIAQLVAAYQEKESKIESEAKKNLQSVLDLHQAEQNQLREELELKFVSQRDETQKEVAKLQDEITQLKTLEKNMTQFVESLKTKVSDAREELEKKELLIEQLKNDLAEQLRTKEKHLKEMFQEDVSRLTKRHFEETQKMLQEFGEAQQFFKQTLSKMEAKLKDADYRYENREPRKQDLDKIAELEEEIKRRKQRTQALIEEADYYRLELTNRDANFNKIFSKQPLVGVIDSAEFETSPSGIKNAGSRKNLTKRTYLNSFLTADSKSESSLVSKLPPISLIRNGGINK